MRGRSQARKYSCGKAGAKDVPGFQDRSSYSREEIWLPRSELKFGMLWEYEVTKTVR